MYFTLSYKYCCLFEKIVQLNSFHIHVHWQFIFIFGKFACDLHIIGIYSLKIAGCLCKKGHAHILNVHVTFCVLYKLFKCKMYIKWDKQLGYQPLFLFVSKKYAFLKIYTVFFFKCKVFLKLKSVVVQKCSLSAVFVYAFLLIFFFHSA